MADNEETGAMTFLKIAASLRGLAASAQEQLDAGEPVDALTLLSDATRRIQNPDEDVILDESDIE
jgi:hypothetical protein